MVLSHGFCIVLRNLTCLTWRLEAHLVVECSELLHCLKFVLEGLFKSFKDGFLFITALCGLRLRRTLEGFHLFGVHSKLLACLDEDTLMLLAVTLGAGAILHWLQVILYHCRIRVLFLCQQTLNTFSEFGFGFGKASA